MPTLSHDHFGSPRARGFHATTVLWRREMLSSLRQVRAFFLLALFCAALIITVWSILDEGGGFLNSASISRSLLSAYFGLLEAAALLLMPPLAASTVCTERQRDCLDLLLAAPIRVRDIIRAKLCGALTFFFLLAISGLPVVGVLFFLVGVDAAQFLASFALVAASATAAAAIGLNTGASRTDPTPAVWSAYFRVFLLFFLLPAFISFISPAYLLFRFAFIASGGLQALSVLPICFYLLGITAACLPAARRRLGAPPLNKKAIRTMHLPLDALPAYVLPQSWLRHPAMRMRHKPVLRTELEGRRASHKWAFGLFLAVSLPWGLLGWGLAYNFRRWNDDDFVWVWAAGLIGIFFLICPALVATRITREYENESMDLFRMTLLRPWQVILGQLATALLALSPILAGAALGGGSFILYARSSAQVAAIFKAHAVLLACVGLWLCIPQFAVILSKRSTPALVLAYASILLCAAVLPLIGLLNIRSALKLIESLTPMTFSAVSAITCAALILACIKIYARQHHRARP